MTIKSTKTIKRSVEKAWEAFTDKNSWHYWYADPLVDVKPEWGKDASLIWRRSSPGTIVEYEPLKKSCYQKPRWYDYHVDVF